MIDSWRKAWKKQGRTDDGVPIIGGRWNIPPLWAGGRLIYLGFFWVFMGLMTASMNPSRRHSIPELERIMNPLAGLAELGLGISCITTGAWMLRTRRKLLKLTSASDVSERFAISDGQLRLLAAEKRIRPRFVVNRQEFYDLSDFGEIATLLRPSGVNPEVEQILLRPAAHAETSTTVLLRPARGESHSAELPTGE